MIETAGDLLQAFAAWLRPSLAGADVALIRPGAAPVAGVSLVVIGVAPSEREPSGSERIAIDVMLLLVAEHADPAMAATLAGDLAFLLASGFWVDQEGERRELRLEKGAGEICRALSLASPLAILVSLPFARRREARRTKPVLQPLAVEIGEIGQMEGVVLGALDGQPPAPLPGARVSAPAFGRSATCDDDGRFRLTGLPPQGAVGLTVDAKGRSREWTVEQRKQIELLMPM